MLRQRKTCREQNYANKFRLFGTTTKIKNRGDKNKTTVKITTSRHKRQMMYVYQGSVKTT